MNAPSPSLPDSTAPARRQGRRAARREPGHGIDRTLAEWWLGVDRWSLGALIMLAGLGTIMIFAASPAIAGRLGLDSWYFVKRHLMHLPLALAVVLALSLLPVPALRRLGMAGFVGAFALMIATLFLGYEVKGAQRWIAVLGQSLQPSEFAKPCFTLLCAWLMARGRERPGFPGRTATIVLLAAILGILLRQPDVGMAALVAATWLMQLFLSGIALGWVVLLGALGLSGLVGAYFAFPHVANRINRFIDPTAGDRFQVDRSLDAFASGGLFGRGPGEGIVKSTLPDAHADFIFAVAGEELGLIACLLILALYTVIVLRSLLRAMASADLFVTLAAAGLTLQFALQALINMASTLHLIPTKGMTLPFISYGGSSLVAVAVTIGMVLGLTRLVPTDGRR
ncbi:MAG: cell division protein FtsW [Alphaproteobacteria bacterium]|nr:cell division protein FtsW [Alphaproteobacteria bacterium]